MIDGVGGAASRHDVTVGPDGRPSRRSGQVPPSRPQPFGPPAVEGQAEWATSQELAADVWRPELERLIERLGLQRGDSVLDAGCGPGRITRWLSARVAPTGHVIGLDHDEAALEWAAWALRDLDGSGAHIELWPGHLEGLPFDDGRFDAAWCSSVLGYLDDPVVAMRELVRVVRPGGTIAVLTGDAARWTFLPIPADLEARLRDAERRAMDSGQWGEPVDLHLGRRLYALARALPVRRVEAVSLLWERTAPLSAAEHRYLHRTVAWLHDPDVRPFLGADWAECRRLFDPASDACVLMRPDLHVLQTASAVVISV